MNPLDTQPGETKYRGVITDWRSKFGFMVTDQMEGKVFLHSKDITEGRVLARVGAEALFQVLPPPLPHPPLLPALSFRCCTRRAVLLEPRL